MSISCHYSSSSQKCSEIKTAHKSLQLFSVEYDINIKLGGIWGRKHADMRCGYAFNDNMLLYMIRKSLKANTWHLG